MASTPLAAALPSGDNMPDDASPKQRIYRELLRDIAPIARNYMTWPWWARKSKVRRWLAAEAELIHNLHISMFERGFVDHDIWFLNAQAREYCRQATFSPFHAQHVALLRELFALVPQEMRAGLKWEGP